MDTGPLSCVTSRVRPLILPVSLIVVYHLTRTESVRFLIPSMNSPNRRDTSLLVLCPMAKGIVKGEQMISAIKKTKY